MGPLGKKYDKFIYEFKFKKYRNIIYFVEDPEDFISGGYFIYGLIAIEYSFFGLVEIFLVVFMKIFVKLTICIYLEQKLIFYLD